MNWMASQQVKRTIKSFIKRLLKNSFILELLTLKENEVGTLWT